MTGFSMEGLSWLPEAPAEFRKLTRALGQEAPATGAALQALATHALDVNRLGQLDKAVTRLDPEIDWGTVSPVRLALLAEGTTDYTAPAIRASALRHGVRVTLYVPAYGQTALEAMSPDSGLARFGADAVLIAETAQSLGLTRATLDGTAADTAVDGALAKVAGLMDGLARTGAATVILQTLPRPADPWTGHFDLRSPGAPAAQITRFNAGLRALAADRAAMLLDVEMLADGVGRARWSDPGQWHRAKLPMALEMVPLYADHVARLLGAMRGKSRKCLVLDLDNTCWGGIIGDDGVDGIRIGQGSAEGEAFLAIQHYALSLKARGVVLAVCSKNEDATARLPFETHPDMALRLDDIAVFVANWTDKASNIAHIAKVLNIGTDALAFLDDNPAERARVRQMLPEVAVPEVGTDPAFYPAALAQSGVFETVGLSADDAKRAEQYRANAQRAVAMEKIGDYGDYLASLEMVCDIRPFDAVGRTRIAQLINKSNQFNLTTRRYTEADVSRMEADAGIFDMQVRLTDTFGDNGMIAVVIFRAGPGVWTCDSWLMSCRVLGRRVEEACLAAVARAARAAGATALEGLYIPSAKNMMVAEHFAKLGFAQAAPAPEDADLPEGTTRWRLELADYTAPDLPLTLTGAFAPAPVDA